MKHWLKELFSEKGGVSMVRLMSFTCCMTACYIAIRGGDLGAVTALLASGFGGKVAQKHFEVRADGPTETDTVPKV